MPPTHAKPNKNTHYATRTASLHFVSGYCALLHGCYCLSAQSRQESVSSFVPFHDKSAPDNLDVSRETLGVNSWDFGVFLVEQSCNSLCLCVLRGCYLVFFMVFLAKHINVSRETLLVCHGPGLTIKKFFLVAH